MTHNIGKFNEKLATKTAHLWKYMKDNYNLLSLSLRIMADKFPEIFMLGEPDNDIKNKRQVYLNIARFFSDKESLPLTVSLGLVHKICNETEEAILRDGVDNISGTEYIKIIKKIVTIQVEYKFNNDRTYDRTYERIIKIVYIKEGQPVLNKITEILNWEEAPGEIREMRLRNGENEVKFELFKMEVK